MAAIVGGCNFDVAEGAPSMGGLDVVSDDGIGASTSGGDNVDDGGSTTSFAPMLDESGNGVDSDPTGPGPGDETGESTTDGGLPGDDDSTTGDPSGGALQPVINEFYTDDDQDGNDFVEIYGEPNASFENLWVVYLTYDDAFWGFSKNGFAEAVARIDRLDANGYAVVYRSMDYNGGTFMLVELSPGESLDQYDDYDGNDDGDLRSPLANADVIDCVAGRDKDEIALYCDVILPEGVQKGASRRPDGADFDVANDWIPSDLERSSQDELPPTVAVPTPGTANQFGTAND